MRTLRHTFKKNGIIYETVRRTDKTGFFKLWFKDTWLKEKVHVGWEVSRINYNPERLMAGVLIEDGESITGDNLFGTDGSRAFFSQDYDDANNYFDVFDKKLHEEKLFPSKSTLVWKK